MTSPAVVSQSSAWCLSINNPFMLDERELAGDEHKVAV